jgi:Na+-driven multidrug efflux pump
LPAAIAGYYSMPMFWLANSFLVRQSDGYGEMAFYVAATNIKSILLFMPSVINSVTSSLLNNIKGSEKRQQYENLFKFNVLVIFLISSITAFILGIFGGFFLEMFGNNFIAAKPILVIVLVSGVFESTAAAIYQRIQNHGMIWLSLIFMNIPVVFLFVITAYCVVPSMGAFGLGIASLVMTLLQLFITKGLAYYIAKQKSVVCHESVLLTGCKLQDH